MTVLVVSSLDDGHVAPVVRELSRRRGICVEVVDHSRFPAELGITIEFSQGKSHISLGRQAAARSIDMREVRAVWWRRPQAFGASPVVTDDRARRFIRSEAWTAFSGAYQCSNAFWVNRPEHDTRASHKPWQLQVAQQVGLTIPDTLMTNDSRAAREFWEACDGKVVYKQFIALPDSWRETRLLSAADIARASTIAFAPVIFQRYVEAVSELRITLVGERIFAAIADLGTAEYPVDVRFNPALHYVPHDIPSELCDRLRALVRELGLVYAAIDMRLTRDGCYVFLEANPAGQFYYVEQMTGQPISAALADALTSTAP